MKYKIKINKYEEYDENEIIKKKIICINKTEKWKIKIYSKKIINIFLNNSFTHSLHLHRHSHLYCNLRWWYFIA